MNELNPNGKYVIINAYKEEKLDVNDERPSDQTISLLNHLINNNHKKFPSIFYSWPNLLKNLIISEFDFHIAFFIDSKKRKESDKK